MLTVTVKDHWQDTKRNHITGVIVASGSYSTGGDTAVFAAGELAKIKSSLPPVVFMLQGITKYLYRVIPATGKILVFIPDTGLELAAGAYPAGITGDSISFYAIFHKY
jgi:hypothetical protein